MDNPKIITKPLYYGDKISKSRSVIGFDRWAGTSRIISFFMEILGWFTVPMEVFFRRNFGQRWFTFANYLAGLVLIVIMALLQEYYGRHTDGLGSYFTWLGPINPFGHHLVYIISNTDDSFFTVVLYAYILIGLFELIKIRWRNYTGKPLHSFDDGTSRLGGLAFLLMGIVNITWFIVIAVSRLFMSPQKRKAKRFTLLISDYDYFARVFLEPALILTLESVTDGVTRIWLFTSAMALIIQTHRKEMARRHKILDFQDSKIESKFMRELKNSLAEKEAVKKNKQAKTTAYHTPSIPVQMVKHPALATIIDELHQKRTNMQ